MEVAQVVPEFAAAFEFDEFNRMQREALPAIVETDENVVACAPTASGKTALAELAICKTLEAGGTALFVAPLRALTNEKEAEWDRFEELGYSVYVVTGERDLNPRRAERADILVMTPEKVDSATRKHDARRYRFITDVDTLVIDEVHLLDSERRGAVLEVTVSRLRRLCAPRVVALSATMPNVEDIAAWLDAPEETTFRFGDEYRPVDLHADVTTYTHGENAFADKYRRLYRALDKAEPHLREDGQALVFVSSRQDTVQAAKKARDVIAERDVPMGARGEYDFHNAAKELDDDTLRQSVLDGVAFHHAGLSTADKNRVEAWFKSGEIQLLFSTSTLAWGVNLPARCVVIRDTKLHDPLEGEVDMSPIDVLQMLGRAGRPGYDDVGYAWVVCDASDADRYRKLLRQGTPIESRLDEHLPTHLNAEIALGTVRDLEDVMDWLETTYAYQRARGDPQADLRDRARGALETLVADGFVETGDDLAVEPTALGVLTSKFYLHLRTGATFHRLVTSVAGEVDDAGTDTTEPAPAADASQVDAPASVTEPDALAGAIDAHDVIAAVAGATEFDSVSARSAEREAIDEVLSGVPTPNLGPGGRKVMAICLAAMSGRQPPSLRGDAWVIKQNARRLLGSLRAFAKRFGSAALANRVTRVTARVEHGVPPAAIGLTAIDGVASGRGHKLADAGIETPADVRAAGVDGLVEAGLGESVAEGVLASARELPAVEIDWGAFPETVAPGDSEFHEVTVRSTAGGATAGVRVTVNGVEMTAQESYLGETTVGVGVFGGEHDELTYRLTVAFPELPLSPVVEERSVRVR